MNLPIYVSADRTCAPKNILIGRQNEKNIDKIVLNVDPALPSLKWYLNSNNYLIPFKNNELHITEELTKKSGTFKCYILGSDAPIGSPITNGSTFFSSNAIYLKVEDR